MREDKIHVQRIGSNIKEENTIKDSCPFWEAGKVNENWIKIRGMPILKTSRCSLKKINCVYGLTNVTVPDKCPLKGARHICHRTSGIVVTVVSLKEG